MLKAAAVTRCVMGDYELLNREVELKDRTPVTQAVEIIMILDGMWLTDFNGDMSHKSVLSKLFKDENVDAAALKESLLNSTHYDQKTRYLGFLLVISAYCVQAIGEYMDNEEIPTNLAWVYICEAERNLSALDIYRQVQLKLKEYIKDESASASEKYNEILNLVITEQAIIKLKKFEPVREKGAAANKAKAKINKVFILKTNSELLVHVDWTRKTLDERAKYIVKECVNQKIKMANGKSYSESYIKKLITGQ